MSGLNAPRQAGAQLVINGMDVSELEKLLAYYRRVRNEGKFRTLLERLSSQDVFVYSRQTKRYVRQVQSVVLPILPRQLDEALWFLGWTVRFMHYYQNRKGEAQALLEQTRRQPLAARSPR